MRRPPGRNSLKLFLISVAADARRYHGGWWKHAGFWAALSYRTRRIRKTGPVYCRALLPVDILLTLVRMVGSACEIPATVRIGPGLYLPHPNGVIMSGTCRLGSNVTIYQQVTLGYWDNLSPRIRSHVAIFAGAKVLGGVTVGQRAFVGANAVVTKDVPAWYVAVGVPAVARPRSDQEGIKQRQARRTGQPDDVMSQEPEVLPATYPQDNRDLSLQSANFSRRFDRVDSHR